MAVTAHWVECFPIAPYSTRAVFTTYHSEKQLKQSVCIYHQRATQDYHQGHHNETTLPHNVRGGNWYLKKLLNWRIGIDNNPIPSRPVYLVYRYMLGSPRVESGSHSPEAPGGDGHPISQLSILGFYLRPADTTPSFSAAR